MAQRGWRALVLALVAVAALALAACGEKGDYAKDVRNIVGPVGEKLQGLGAQLQQNGTPQEKIDQLDQAQTEIEGAAKKLEDLKPPDDVKKEHEDYVAKLKALATQVKAVKEALQNRDQAALQDSLQKLQAAGEDVRTAEDALSKKIE